MEYERIYITDTNESVLSNYLELGYDICGSLFINTEKEIINFKSDIFALEIHFSSIIFAEDEITVREIDSDVYYVFDPNDKISIKEEQDG